MRATMVDVKRLVVFAILMENGEGIVDKSVDYICEKYELALSTPYPEQLLDLGNKRKLERWKRIWLRKG